jgi:hypothetical protein
LSQDSDSANFRAALDKEVQSHQDAANPDNRSANCHAALASFRRRVVQWRNFAEPNQHVMTQSPASSYRIRAQYSPDRRIEQTVFYPAVW